MQENHLTGPESTILSIVYLAAEEGKNTELLLFDERFISEQNWKQKASEKSKRLIERLRVRYDQVTCELFASDRFVRRLQKLKKIKVILNHPIDPTLVRNRLKVMLRDRSYHHLRWMIIDGILLPFTLVMMPVPGPNLIGYYLLFRVYSHWKAYRSASRTHLEEVDVEVNGKAGEVHEALQKSKDIRTALHELRKRFGLRALQEHKFVPQSSAFREAWKNFKKEE